MSGHEVLQEIINGLRNASRQILTELPKITRKINQFAGLMIQQLAEYEWKCKVMLEDMQNNRGNLDLSKVSKWTIPKVVIDERLKNENFFILKDVCKEFLNASQKIALCLRHSESNLVEFRCKNEHCKECIKELIEANIEICPCGVVLSMKEKDSVLENNDIFNRRIII